MKPKFIRLVICVAIIICTTNARGDQSPFALQKYPLDELRIWYVVPRGAYTFAYVLDKDGYIYHVEKSEYIGNRHGEVSKIDSCGIWLVELVQGPTGDWKESRAFLGVNDIEARKTCLNKRKQWLGQ